jgi:hypothetical protein
MQGQQQRYDACTKCLNTPDGKVLMEELKAELDDVEVWDADPLKMAKKAAGRDLFKVLCAMQTGEEIQDV